MMPPLRLQQALLVVSFVALWTVAPAVDAQPSAAYLAKQGTSAVDIRGVRRDSATYTGQFPPWVKDQVRSVAPQYPPQERRRRTEGAGLFRLQLDVQTGRVTTVIIAKSTGSHSLDAAAVKALQKWQWKPGRWKQIDMPVTFTIGDPMDRPPKGSISLPVW